MNYLEIYFNGILKQSLSIKTDVLSIGRSSGNDIIINNMGVSGYHAVISKKDNMFYIEDLNSTNGTFLNGQKVLSQQRVNLEDTISVGKHMIRFSEWSQDIGTESAANQDVSDATIIMSKPPTAQITVTQERPEKMATPEQKQYYLMVKGELSGMTKLLLSKNSYKIGKAKDNDIRIGGWFTPAYIAEIEKVGHSFYISSIKNRKVTVNNKKITSNYLISAPDEIRIKKLLLKCVTD